MIKIITDALKRFDDFYRKPGILKQEQLGQFIKKELESSYLAGRTCRQNEIDYHVQEEIRKALNKKRQDFRYILDKELKEWNSGGQYYDNVSEAINSIKSQV